MLYKYERGVWRPTVPSLIIRDLCQEMNNEKSFLYQSYTNINLLYINENSYQQTYRLKPFSLSIVIENTLISSERRYQLQFFHYHFYSLRFVLY